MGTVCCMENGNEARTTAVPLVPRRVALSKHKSRRQKHALNVFSVSEKWDTLSMYLCHWIRTLYGNGSSHVKMKLQWMLLQYTTQDIQSRRYMNVYEKMQCVWTSNFCLFLRSASMVRSTNVLVALFACSCRLFLLFLDCPLPGYPSCMDDWSDRWALD